MLRISSTMVEKYRAFRDEDTFFGNIVVTEEKLLDSIISPTKQIKATQGTAFHEVLEKPHECYERSIHQTGELGFMSSTGIFFPFDCISEKCLPEIDYKYPFEVKAEKLYLVNGEIIKIVAKADQLEGKIINEHKSTWGEIYLTNTEHGKEKTSGESFDIDRYFKSIQWRLYNDVFNAMATRYKVFEFAIDKTDNFQIKYIDKHIFEMPTYESMQDDIKEILQEFAFYIHQKQLESYFKDN